MQPFTYVAYNAKGQRKTGTLVAESERAAFDALKAQGLMASDIEAMSPCAFNASNAARSLSATSVPVLR